jgi:hypothetical protein
VQQAAEREVSYWRVCEREAEEAVRQQVLRRPKGIGQPHPPSPSKCFPLHLYIPSKVLRVDSPLFLLSSSLLVSSWLEVGLRRREEEGGGGKEGKHTQA